MFIKLLKKPTYRTSHDREISLAEFMPQYTEGVLFKADMKLLQWFRF